MTTTTTTTTTTRAAAALLLLLSAASCAAAGEAGERWAVLVAGSNNWYNYRHQADVCHAYQILSRNGFPEDRIVLMRYDDLEYNPLNPLPGAVINTPDCVPTDKDENGKWVLKKGCNVNENCPKHYFGAAVSPEAFINILRGDQDQATKLCDDINEDATKFGGCNARGEWEASKQRRCHQPFTDSFSSPQFSTPPPRTTFSWPSSTTAGPA